MREIKLFVSYSHADLKPRPGFNDSRVGRIMADVKYDLDCHSARSPFKILRDAEITVAADNFRDFIQKAITGCDMAIAFLSSNYCASEECEAEFAELIRIGKPIFLVDTEPTWFNDDQNRITKHRNAIKDILFVPFWEKDQNKSIVRFGFPLPDVDAATRKSYYDAVQALVTGLKKHAAKLLEADGPAADEGHRRYAVFMACPTADVKADATRLADALEADGHSVVVFDPELDLRDAASLAEVVATPLTKSDVYVQLLGAVPGRSVPGSDLRLVRAQYELAKKADKTIYAWRASGFDIEECQPDYGSFLKEIALTCHLGNYLEFEKYVQKKLADLGAQREAEERKVERDKAAAAAGAKRALPLVAIDAAPGDRDLAEKITDALQNYVDIDNLDYDLTAKALADAVVDSNALVLAYGKSPEGQKRAQAHFKLVRRQSAEIASKSLELAVGNGAPPTAPPCPRGPNVHVISVADTVDTAAMFGFLKRLGVAVPQENEAG